MHKLSLAETDCETKEMRSFGEPVYDGLKVHTLECAMRAHLSVSKASMTSVKSPGPCI